MKVHLIRRETIESYMIVQALGRPSLEDWLEKIKRGHPMQKKICNIQWTIIKKIMERLKYTIVRSQQQYAKYCKMLEILLDSRSKNRLIQEEIDLLTLLIEKWDEEHSTLNEVDPIRLLHSLMADHGMKDKRPCRLAKHEQRLRLRHPPLQKRLVQRGHSKTGRTV